MVELTSHALTRITGLALLAIGLFAGESLCASEEAFLAARIHHKACSAAIQESVASLNLWKAAVDAPSPDTQKEQRLRLIFEQWVEEAELEFRREGAYQTKEMELDGRMRFARGEHVVAPEHLHFYRLLAREGLFWTQDTSGNSKRFDSSSSRAYTSPRTSEALFVMTGDGEFFASNYRELGKFHHSAFTGGGPVASAGTLVVHAGKVQEISNQSGHYKHSGPELAQAVAQLKKLGVLAPIVTVHLEGGAYYRDSFSLTVEKH